MLIYLQQNIKKMFENNYKCAIIVLCTCGGMVDAADSKSAGGDFVGVQVPSRAPICNESLTGIFFLNSVYKIIIVFGMAFWIKMIIKNLKKIIK